MGGKGLFCDNPSDGYFVSIGTNRYCFVTLSKHLVIQEERFMDKRPTTRFSVDFQEKQHAFLKEFAAKNNTKNTVLMRALLYRLEIDEAFANKVIDQVRNQF